MEILGLGTDIIEIERVQDAVERIKGFKERVFTAAEIEYAERRVKKYEVYAGRFASKEAVGKALGTGIAGFELKEIEILNDEKGKPYVVFYGEAEKKFEGKSVMLSISHDRNIAMATAILIGN